MASLIYEEVRTAIQAALPNMITDILAACIELRDKVDELPEYPTFAQAADAIGCSTRMIRRYEHEGIFEPVFIAGSNTKRIKREDIKTVLITECRLNPAKLLNTDRQIIAEKIRKMAS